MADRSLDGPRRLEHRGDDFGGIWGPASCERRLERAHQRIGRCFGPLGGFTPIWRKARTHDPFRVRRDELGSGGHDSRFGSTQVGFDDAGRFGDFRVSGEELDSCLADLQMRRAQEALEKSEPRSLDGPTSHDFEKGALAGFASIALRQQRVVDATIHEERGRAAS